MVIVSPVANSDSHYGKLLSAGVRKQMATQPVTATGITYACGNNFVVVSQESGNLRNNYVVDHLGSIRKVIDFSSNLIIGNDYYAFVPQSNSSDFSFIGKELDNSGILYYGGRYYDSNTSRFITADLAKSDLEAPQSLNRDSDNTINNQLKKVNPIRVQSVGRIPEISNLKKKPAVSESSAPCTKTESLHGLIPRSLPKRNREAEWQTHYADKAQHFFIGFIAEKANNILVSDVLGIEKPWLNTGLRLVLTSAAIAAPEFIEVYEPNWGGQPYWSWEDVGFGIAGALYSTVAKAHSYPVVDLGKGSTLTSFTVFLPGYEHVEKYGGYLKGTVKYHSYSALALQTPAKYLSFVGKPLEKLGIDTLKLYLSAVKGEGPGPFDILGR